MGAQDNSRYQSILTPLSRCKNRAFMRPPDGGRPLGSHTPKHDPAICISGHKTTISSDEGCRVNLGSMPTEYVSWLSRRERHCGWLVFRAGRGFIQCSLDVDPSSQRSWRLRILLKPRFTGTMTNGRWGNRRQFPEGNAGSCYCMTKQAIGYSASEARKLQAPLVQIRNGNKLRRSLGVNDGLMHLSIFVYE